MYQAKHLEAFIDKVHKEAAVAAQAVYDKYEAELLERIKAQLHPDHIVYMAMGSASIAHKNKAIELQHDHANAFKMELSCLQYWDKVDAGFHTPHMMNKFGVIKQS